MSDESQSMSNAGATRVEAYGHGLPVPQVDAERLFSGANRIAILHAGETYLLTRTRQNKLLLTKQV